LVNIAFVAIGGTARRFLLLDLPDLRLGGGVSGIFLAFGGFLAKFFWRLGDFGGEFWEKFGGFLQVV